MSLPIDVSADFKISSKGHQFEKPLQKIDQFYSV